MRASLLWSVAATLLLGNQAQALTLTNRDTSPRQVLITEIDEEAIRTVIIEPAQTLDGFCEDGCSIVIQDGEEMTFEGDEVVYIEDGHLEIAE